MELKEDTIRGRHLIRINFIYLSTLIINRSIDLYGVKRGYQGVSTLQNVTVILFHLLI